MPNSKCLDMVAPKLSFKDDGEKQVLVLHLTKLKVSELYLANHFFSSLFLNLMKKHLNSKLYVYLTLKTRINSKSLAKSFL